MTDEHPEDLIRALIAMARANETRMDGSMTAVMDLINANDVVWGVWQDSTKPGGVDAMIVKGVNWLREISATRVGRQLRVTAIKCVEYEQAEALRLHVADAADAVDLTH